MLLRVISRQLRPCALYHRVNYHLAAETNLLHRCPALCLLQSTRSLKKKAPLAVQSDAIDGKKPQIISNEKELLLLQNDPDVFGTLSQSKPFVEGQEAAAEDEGDIAESDRIESGPFRSQQLGTRHYANMIKEHFKYKRVKEAIDVLEVRMLKEDRVKPQNYIYNLLIGECGRLGYAQKAFQLYNRMKQRRLKITGGTYTALFNACANSPFPGDALEKANNLRKIMLQNGYVPNETNYNAMIKAFGRCNDINTAFELVDEMKGLKLLLKVDTFNFLLQACISEKEFGFRHALIVWHKMYHKKIKPDLYSFNLMLKCVEDCGIGDLDTMRSVIGQVISQHNPTEKKLKVRKGELLEIQPKKEAKPNETDEDMGENVGGEHATTTDTETSDVQMASTKPSSGEAPNLLSKTPHLGSLVALKTVKLPEDRLLLLGGMDGFINEMNAAEVRPDIKTFTKMLNIIPSTRAAEHKLIELVRKANVSVDVDFFNMLIKKRSMRYDFESAKEVLQLIEIAKLEPDIVTYGILALGCKSLDDAKEYLQRLHDEGIKLNIEILGAMLKSACWLTDYDYVLEVLHNCKTNKLKPSAKFLAILYKFNEFAFGRLRSKKITKHDRNEYFRFSREFQKWKSDMNLHGLDKEAAIKAVGEHPWKQFKEAQPGGEESAKNTRIQTYKKKKHSIRKLTKTRVEKGGEPTPAPTRVKNEKTIGNDSVSQPTNEIPKRSPQSDENELMK